MCGRVSISQTISLPGSLSAGRAIYLPIADQFHSCVYLLTLSPLVYLPFLLYFTLIIFVLSSLRRLNPLRNPDHLSRTDRCPLTLQLCYARTRPVSSSTPSFAIPQVPRSHSLAFRPYCMPQSDS